MKKAKHLLHPGECLTNGFVDVLDPDGDVRLLIRGQVDFPRLPIRVVVPDEHVEHHGVRIVPILGRHLFDPFSLSFSQVIDMARLKSRIEDLSVKYLLLFIRVLGTSVEVERQVGKHDKEPIPNSQPSSSC